MTDHEDGPPSRGPRRYGPSAPRSGGRPIVPPRGVLRRRRRLPGVRSGRPGNTADRRRPDSSGRFPQDDRRRPAGDNGFTGGPYQPDAPVGPRAWSAADRPPPSDRRFPDRVSAGVPAQSDRRITEPRRSPPLPPTDGRPRPPHGPGKRRRAQPAARPGDPTRPLAPQTVDRPAGRRRAVGHHPGGVRVRVVRVRQHRPAGQGHHLRLRRRLHLHRHHDPARRLRRPGRRRGQPAQRRGAAAVATEADGGGTSTDTMMLIHIPAGGGRATAVSIPRDSWIADPPPGPSNTGDDLVPYAANKVNSFYGSAKFYTQEKLVAAGVTDAATVERESSNAGRKMLISVLEEHHRGAHRPLRRDQPVRLLPAVERHRRGPGLPGRTGERPVLRRRLRRRPAGGLRAPRRCRSSGSGTVCPTATWTGCGASRRSCPARSRRCCRWAP